MNRRHFFSLVPALAGLAMGIKPEVRRWEFDSRDDAIRKFSQVWAGLRSGYQVSISRSKPGERYVVVLEPTQTNLPTGQVAYLTQRK